MVPYSDFRILLLDAQEVDTFELFAADCGGRLPEGNTQQSLRLLSIVWQMAHDGLTIRSIAAAAGTSVRQIGIRYGINQRTLETWSSNAIQNTAWKLPMLAYAVLSDLVSA